MEQAQALAAASRRDETSYKQLESRKEKQTTIIMTGMTGGGKSSAANRILGEKRFKTGRQQSSVTTCCQRESQFVGHLNRNVTVMDTPGLPMDPLLGGKELAEIAESIKHTKDGIDAFVIVLSALTRFSEGEARALQNWQSLFGQNFMDYCIVLFTGGDALEEEGVSFEQHCLEGGLSSPLMELLGKCGHRKVLFNNKVFSGVKREQELQTLFQLIDGVVELNEGRPYSSEMIEQAQALAAASKKKALSLNQSTNRVRWAGDSSNANYADRYDMEHEKRKHAMAQQGHAYYAELMSLQQTLRRADYERACLRDREACRNNLINIIKDFPCNIM